MPKETKRSSVFIHLDGESNFLNAQINYETIYKDETGAVIYTEPADSEQLATSDLTLDDLLPKILEPIKDNAELLKLRAENTALTEIVEAL